MFTIKSPLHGSALLVAALAAVAIAPAAASAAQRYADPNGSGVDCTSVAPCSFATAFTAAAVGDEITIAPGDYPLTVSLDDIGSLDVHGVAGQPRPRLMFSGVQNGLRVNGGSKLHHVEVDQAFDSSAIFVSGATTVDDVIARGTDVSSPTVAAGGKSVIRNSIFVAGGANSRAVSTETSGGNNSTVLRNVTAVATGTGGVGVWVRSLFAAGKVSVTLFNVVAHGGPGGADLAVKTDSSGAQGTIAATHSNFAVTTVTGTNALLDLSGGGNQSGAPVFADPAAGDYHEAPGSPTVDAGIDDPLNGQFDVDGDARLFGGGTDIGGDEYVPPPPPPPAGGSSDPAPASDPVPVSDPASPEAPPATAPSTVPTHGEGFGGVLLVSGKLRLVGQYVTLRLSCPADTAGSCTGRTRLATRGGAHASSVLLGRARFAVAPGRQVKVKVHVSRAARRQLARVRRVRGLVTNATRNGAGESAQSVAAVTIRRA